MNYDGINIKIPEESPTYKEDSRFVISQIMAILDKRAEVGDNKIVINTNLKNGLPLENINKIAGPV